MKVRTLVILIVGIVVLSAARSDAKTLGSWIRKQTENLDRKVQDHLNKHPKVQRRINRGIDKFSDNLIDYVTPDADKDCRRIQKDAIQFMLNPNHEKNSRHLDSMINGASGRSAVADKTAKDNKKVKHVSRRDSEVNTRYDGISKHEAQRQKEHEEQMRNSRTYRWGYKIGKTVKGIKKFFKR
jgi:hypothetical protein